MLYGLTAVALLGAILVAVGAAQIVRSSVRDRYLERIRAETALLSGYRAARARADERLLYLKIQREALGLRNHALVEELYRLPPPR